MSPIVITQRPRVRPGDPAADLAWQLWNGLELVMTREFPFHPTRKWRFDLAAIGPKLAIEIEGGFFLKDGGRHTRGAGARSDCEKYNEAVLLGWRVLRVLPEWVQSGQAFSLVARAVNGTP